MAISWKRNAAHEPAPAHLPVAARYRAISRKGRRALRIREKYLSRGGFLRCVRVKSPHSGRNDIMGQCVHRCHFERSREIPCGRNGTTRTRASPFAGALVPPAGSPCGQVVNARTYLWQNVVGAFLVPPATELTRRHFDRRDNGVERFPAIEKQSAVIDP